jgi:DNA-binding NtrC family response regulator
MHEQTVLIVDDEPMIGLWLEDILLDQGFGAVVASDPRDANSVIDERRSLAALITDIDLGRGLPSGWDVARHAREIDPRIPVIYITGKSAAEWAEQGVVHSILLLKPFSTAEVTQAITQVRAARHGKVG